MNIHGFLRDMPFEVLCQKENEISLVNTYTNDTLSLYPYKYKVIVTYTLMQNTLRTKINVVNEYEELLPFNLGAIRLQLPAISGRGFSDYTIHFAHAETFSSPKVESNGT